MCSSDLIVGAFGVELTGKYVDEVLSGGDAEFAHTVYRAVCDTGNAAFALSAHSPVKGSPLTARRVLMPLTEDGQAVSMIFGAATFALASPSRPGAGLPASHFEIIG